MNKRILLLLCAMVLSVSPAFAQFKVSGVVSDENGDPIPFASVVVKGTSTGTAADADGKYSISAPSSKSVLIFSSIGFANEEITLNGKSSVNVTLGPDAEALDEVMVVAYGQATKSSFTGSAGKVKGEKIELVPSLSPINTLNGTTPGLRLTAATGQPGTDATITIRGIGSLNGNTDPLIVMDGAIYAGNLSTIPSSDIESITVLKDAASTALYGSRAANGVIMITSKQGKGEKPTIKVNISHGFVTREQRDYKVMNVKDYMESYWQQLYNDEMLGGKVTDEVARENASKNVLAKHNFDDDYNPFFGEGVTANNVVGLDGKFNPNAQLKWADDIDWAGGTEQVGQVQDYGISASGKGKYTTYFGSLSYTNKEGYMKGTAFERFAARANVSFEKKWFKFGVNLSASISDQSGNLTTSAGDGANAYYIGVRISPIYPIHRHYPDGSYVLDDEGNKRWDYGEGYTNPDGSKIPARADYKFNVINYCEDRYNHHFRNIINAKPYMEIKFLKDFKLAVNASLYNSDYKSHSATPYYKDRTAATTSASIELSGTRTWTFNQLLTWNHAFGDHHVDALLGHEVYSYNYWNHTAGRKNQIIIGRNFEFNNYADQGDAAAGYNNNYRTEGFFARVNYDYAGRYFASASFRRDGSSKFSDAARWGNFWSVGGSWMMSNEKWMKDVDWIDMLKVRASIGTVGNDDLDGYYKYKALYTLRQNGDQPGYSQSLESPGNDNLKWEISTNWDAAVEFAFFKHRFTGSVEYFHHLTTNLLMDVTLPSSTGLTSYPANEGGLLNHGVELVLGGDIIRTKTVTWNLGFNASFITNKITNLPIPAYTKNSSYNRVEEGHSVHEWWLYQWVGVDPERGVNYYELGNSYFKEDGSYIDNIDSNKDVININGKYYTTAPGTSKEDFSGSPIPTVFGGINTSLKVWRFNLDVNLYYQLGGKIYDRGYANTLQQGFVGDTKPYQNRHQDALNAWTTPGQKTDVAILTTSGTALGSSTYSENVAAARSTRWLTTSNCLEINNITLSYDFSKKLCKKIGIQGAKVYASADHLALWNSRNGLYSNYSLSNYTSHGSYAKPARTISLGLNFTL